MFFSMDFVGRFISPLLRISLDNVRLRLDMGQSSGIVCHAVTMLVNRRQPW